jgi:hypothetical protein
MATNTNNNNNSIPASLSQHFQNTDKALDFAGCLKCSGCNTFAAFCVADLSLDPSGRTFSLNCQNSSCSGRPTQRDWYACFECGQKVSNRKDRIRNHVASHSAIQSKRHAEPPQKIQKTSQLYSMPMSPPERKPTEVATEHQWLADLMNDSDMPTAEELIISKIAFPEDELLNMQHYWAAEHSKKGGGIQYLVACAFRKTDKLTASMLPTQTEADFHIQSFIQHTAMNEKQRKRQAHMMDFLRSYLNVSEMFSRTYIPSAREAKQLYGNSGKHSLWNTLPTPPVTHFDGIAYVNPVHIIRFAFANGMQLDDIFVKKDDPPPTQSPVGKKPVHFVDETFEIHQMKIDVLNGDNNQPLVVCVYVVDWRDGFGSNRTKQNRKPITLWTITFSPAKDKINSVDNTFILALGLKKSSNWRKVEHQFRKDMEALSNPDKPLFVYHGGVQKMVPIFVKRIVSLEDKVERADYTATAGHSSNFHRRFGKACHFRTPLCQSDEIAKFLKERKIGLKDDKIACGWSFDYVNCSTTNGGRFPSCRDCRLKRIQSLRTNDLSAVAATPQCSSCADWEMSESTRHLLLFDAPKNYPEMVADPFNLQGVCPVEAPAGREVGLKRLSYIDVTFKVLVQAVKFAFYNYSRPQHPKSRQQPEKKVKNWTREQMTAYLQTFCIGDAIQKEICDAALAARDAGHEPIDYNLPDRIGNFHFPAAWMAGLPVTNHIELLMHLLFLGITEKNFDLVVTWLKMEKMGDATFRSHCQPLLEALSKFQLSWLKCHPFNEKKSKTTDKKTTGGWVSENWMAFVRVSKVLYGWCHRKGEESARRGSEDVLRMIISFTAVVAHVMTHGGVTREIIDRTWYYIKEFLCCVRELDLHVNHQNMKSFPAKGKQPEPYWLKTNYMSLMNLIEMMEHFGALVNLWDGGRKGERFVQMVKPFIPRGVTDVITFFVRLVERLYKMKFLATLDRIDGIYDTSTFDLSNVEELLFDRQGNIRRSHWDRVDEPQDSGSDDESDVDDDGSEDESQSQTDAQSEKKISQVEDLGMLKDKTVFIYPKKEVLEGEIASNKPITGFLVEENNRDQLSAYCAYKLPGKSLGWTKVTFDDKEGINFCGLFYSPLRLESTNCPAPKNMEAIKRLAKMSFIAIPMKYCTGMDDDHSRKVCVLTNWWKERTSQGRYKLPGLDFSFYQKCNTDEKQQNHAPVLINNNHELPLPPNFSRQREENGDANSIMEIGVI